MPNKNIFIIQSSWGIGFRCKGDVTNIWNAPCFYFIINQINVGYEILDWMLSRRIKLYLHNSMRSKANNKCRVHKIAFNSVTNVILWNKVMSC